MKICVRLPDPLLTRALVDLLDAYGHEVKAVARDSEPCALLIGTRAPHHEEPAQAVLVLQRGVEAPPDREPRKALERALRERGTAVWSAPLDAGLLLEVIGGHEGCARAAPSTPPIAPDLSDSPHSWLVIDPETGQVVACSDAARDRLGIEDSTEELTLADLHLGEALNERLVEDSEGVRAGDLVGRGNIVAWWTDRNGLRIACFLEAGPMDSAAARHRESLAEIGRMAATLAHEIRNPVASLAGALDLLESETDPDDRAEVLSMARERLRQMSSLLDKTLNLSRPITGAPEAVELRPAIDSALSNLSLHPKFEHIKIEFDMPVSPVPVNAYEGPLVQTLTNLLLNAAQAQSGQGTIRISLRTDARRAILRVHDEGPGIPFEKRARIFKPFYTTRPDGTGLGLAEVRRAMNAMGGTVSLDEVERGACFRLELPLAQSH